jgi:hypothetical protein
MPDVMPSIKGIQYFLWLAAIVLIIIRRYYTVAIGLALLSGVLRRAGKIQFNTDFV